VQDLKKLLKVLLENDVDFVLIGGFAAVVHGSTSVTQDIDICAAITEEQISKLRNILKEYNPWHRMDLDKQLSFLEHPKSVEGVKNIYLQTDLGVLDILSETQPAGDFKTIKKHSIEVPLYGHNCRVISINDLLKVKETMKRPKDLQVAEELKKIIDIKK
jgi:predicted nucleotidyltransferase